MTQKHTRETNSRETILIVEDDRSLRNGLAINFRFRGFNVLTASDGEEGMRMAFDEKPDLVVLDIMLPGWSGLDILDSLREHDEQMPVLILSARDTTSNKVEGLSLGADDYLTKPFELPELLARAEALLRRRRVNQRIEPDIKVGPVVIKLDKRLVLVEEQLLELSAKEFEILLVLAKSRGRPVSRQELLNRVWGWDFEGTTRTVDNFIRSLRQKIEVDPARPVYLKTVRQVGYKLVPDSDVYN